MIGKHVVIDTLDNFKAKLDLIPSSAIVLIKDVGQIYAHGTYFGAQKTYSLLTKTADGLAPKGGTSASSLISDVNTEWVLTVTNGENPTWRKLPANAFNSSSYTLPSATASDLGGIKVGQVYTATFDDLVGQYYKINVDKNGLAYVHVPWINNPYTASGSGITLKDNVFSLSLNSVTKLDLAIGNKIYAVSLDKNGKLCVSVPWVDTNNIFVGATETINGSSGMVPAPIANQHRYFLRGDGTWVKPNLSDLNDDVVNGKYLPLSGGTISSSNYGGLIISRTGAGFSAITYSNSSDGILGYIGIGGSGSKYPKQPTLINDDGTYVIWNETNFNPSDYLSLSGGTISGSLVIQASSPGVTFEKSNELNPFASLGIYSNKLSMYVNSENKYYDILHSGNYSQYALPLKGGTLKDTLKINTSHSNYVQHRINDVVKAEVGYHPLYGVFIKNETSNKFLNVTDKGDALFDGKTIYHSGNFNPSDYLPLSGGTITGGSGVYTPLMIKNINLSEIWIGFQDSIGTCYIGSSKGVPSVNMGADNKTIIHSGNIGSQSVNYATGSLFSNRLSMADFYPTDEVSIATLSSWYKWGSFDAFSAYAYGIILASPDINHKILLGVSPFDDIVRVKAKLGADRWTDWREIAFTDSNVASANNLTKTWKEDPNYVATSNSVKIISNTTGTAGNYATGYSSGLSVISDYVGWQLMSDGGGVENPYFRSIQDNNVWKPWRQIAFLTDNVASATKLQTARTIWGQSFDGTGDISGHMTLTTGFDAGGVNMFLVTDNAYVGSIWYNSVWRGTTHSFYVNGSTAMTILDNGNVGIGTTSPSSKLHLCSTENTTLRIQSDGSGGDQGAICMKKASGNGLVFAVENRDFIWQTGSASLTGGGTERMRLTSGGNVGIGTTNPAYKLDVNGDIATSQYLRVKAWSGYGSGICSMWYNGNTTQLILDSGASLGYNLDVNGTISANSSNVMSLKLNSSKIDWGFAYNGIGIYHSNSQKGGFGWNSEPAGLSNVGFYFKNYVSGDCISLFNEGGICFIGGNVGIGTANPLQKLHVNGNTKVSGSVCINSVELAYSSSALAVYTPSGKSWFGMMNEGYCHIYTDAPAFYFNKSSVYANGYLIWHSGNDGSGSGLDADLLDGYHISVGAAGTNSSTIYFVT